MYAALTMFVAAAAEPPRGSWQAGPHLEQMRQEVADEVDAYVSDLGPVRRRLVRWALIRATEPCARVEIGDRAGGVAITCDDRKTAIAPADGQETEFVGDDGRSLVLTHLAEPDGTLVQTFTGKQGTRTNRFVPAAGGGLTVEVTIRSPQLDQPLRYQLRYDR